MSINGLVSGFGHRRDHQGDDRGRAEPADPSEPAQDEAPGDRRRLHVDPHRLTALDTPANALRRPADWQARTATASSTTSPSRLRPGPGGLAEFQVTSLAARHSTRSGNTISATPT